MGFASKALQIAEPEIAKLNFNKIILEINEENSNSISVAKKNNYRFQETGCIMKKFVKILQNSCR